jgi:UDP-N-acetylmuramyl pentapeptide phosphotransferase/UDP-N-acetylglucosamine-1-phosphate transferase
MTARKCFAAVVATLLGLGAMVWLLPLAARIPFYVPPDLYDRLHAHGASKPPFGGLIMLTEVAVGVLLVALCLNLYLWWTERPLVIQYASRKERDP